MKPIILTGHTHHIKPIAEICLPSKQTWAKRHGHELVVLTDDDFPRQYGHPSFQKLRWIRSYLDSDGPVIWLDADVLITNLSRDPASLLPMPPYALSASLDYKIGDRDAGKAWSAGNMAWMPTDSAFAWLDQAMKDEGARWGGLWDQDALQNCQPDDVLEIRHPRIMNAVLPEFGLEASWLPGDFLIHFTGIAPEDRLAAAQAFVTKHLQPLPPYRVGDNLTGLQDLVREHVRPGMQVLEIGAFIGASTNVFLDAGAHVTSVDPWAEQMPGYHVEGDIFDAWHRNTGGRALSYRATGSLFFQRCPYPCFDLAYIDAVHTYEAVRDDIAGCLTVLKPRGKLAGHDYHPQHFPGVCRAVDEAAARLGMRVKTYRDTSWIIA